MSDAFTKVEDAEDKICSILDLFCDIQGDICNKLETNYDDDFENSIDQQIDNSMSGENLPAENELEAKISQIGFNLKAIQANLHEVVNSIQTLESTKQAQF